MASYSANRAKTITMVSAQVDDITLTGGGPYLIYNHGTTPIYYLASKVAVPANPTVAGDDMDVLLPTSVEEIDPFGTSSFVIKVISTGTPTFTVKGA